jgi:DNA-binding PadR family transcriptional regulator
MSRIESLPTEDAAENDSPITVSQLRAEIAGGESQPQSPGISDIVADIDLSFFDSESFTFDEGNIKSSLDELLLSLVALRSSNTHGKQLLDDLETEFDTALSPGTVYPRLHKLCDKGVLEQRELVKTKEYTVSDEGDTHERIAEAARQHLALGMVLHAALERGDLE